MVFRRSIQSKPLICQVPWCNRSVLENGDHLYRIRGVKAALVDVSKYGGYLISGYKIYLVQDVVSDLLHFSCLYQYFTGVTKFLQVAILRSELEVLWISQAGVINDLRIYSEISFKSKIK